MPKKISQNLEEFIKRNVTGICFWQVKYPKPFQALGSREKAKDWVSDAKKYSSWKQQIGSI
jgi:hypothetical protein